MDTLKSALKPALSLFALCLAPSLWATDYTWTGAVSTAWNVPANWSPSTGVPSEGDNVLVPSTVRVLFLDADRTVNSFSVDSGRVDLAQHTLTYTGNGTFFGGGVDHGLLAPNSPNGMTTFAYTKFDARINGSTNGVQFNGSRFNAPVRIIKTGTAIDASQGGNIFNSTVELVITGAGEVRMCSMAADLFNDDLLLNCTGTGAIRFGYGLGTGTLADGATVSIGSTGFTSGTLSFARFTQVGSTPQVLALGDGASLGFHVGTVFNGPVTSTSGKLSFAVATFNASGRFTKTGVSEDISSGYSTFNGPTELIMAGNGRLRMADLDGDFYNGDLTLSNAGTGEILFGFSGGASTLAAGRAIAIGTGGFANGALHLAHFTQNGTTAQTLTLGTNASLYLEQGNTFNGDLTCAAGQLRVSGSTFNGSSTFTKTADGVSDCAGGNTFNGTATVNNAGTGSIWFGAAAMDVFNGAAAFHNSTSGGLIIGQGSDVRFRRNVSTQGHVEFGSSVTGSMRTIFDGTTPQRLITDGTDVPTISNLTMATGAHGGLDLFGTVLVTRDLAFTSGVIRPRASTATGNGLLVLGDNLTMSDMADAASHVEGYVRKVGDDAFVFPVGRSGMYAPIAISAPASATDHFTANYEHDDVTPNDPLLHDPTLDAVSNCEHWTLDRTNGSSAVTVTLSYDASRSCGVTDPSRLAVAGWDGSRWTDHGGGAFGTPDVGTVMSSGPITACTEFTLALSTMRESDPSRPGRAPSESNGQATSVEEQDAATPDVTVYPNPTTGEAMVVLHGLQEGPLTLTVLDMGGKQVREASRTVRSSTLVAPLTLDGLPAGMYLVRAMQAEGRPMEVRVIKQ